MKENKVVAWVKAHKTELLIFGGIALTAFGTFSIVENWKYANEAVLEETKTTPSLSCNAKIEVPDIPVAESDIVTKTVDVKEHRRTLPLGYHPSSAKRAEAEKNGIELGERQTIVSAHPRCYVM